MCSLPSVVILDPLLQTVMVLEASYCCQPLLAVKVSQEVVRGGVEAERGKNGEVEWERSISATPVCAVCS